MKNEDAKNSISWEIDIPLATNPFILRDLVKLFAITFFIMFTLFSLIFFTMGEIESIIPMMKVFLVVLGVLMVFFWLIMAVFFGNRFSMRFILTDKTVGYETISRKAKVANRLAIILGLLTGKARLAGTGLIATTTENLEIPWNGIVKITEYPTRRAIALSNSWRTMMIIYCHKDNYEKVLEYIKNQTSQHNNIVGSSVKRKSPLLRALLYSFLVIVAVYPLLTAPYPFEISLLIILLIIGFSMATIWLVPIFGYVVITLVLLTAGIIVSIAFKLETSELFGYTYRNYENFYPEDWAFLGMAVLGMSYLVWLSISAIKGKVTSMLMGDYEGEN